MATAPLFDLKGARAGDAELGDAIFGQEPRIDLVHLAVQRELWNRRQGTHDCKSRAEVKGGGKKPFRQKGTGRARQGSTRAPQFRHGGVVHGPTPHGYNRDMPQKMRRAALRSALSGKLSDGSVRVVEDVLGDEISTKRFADWVGKLETEGTIVLVLSERNENAILSARNLPQVRVIVLPGLSTYEIVRAGTLVFTKAAVSRLEELYSA